MRIDTDSREKNIAELAAIVEKVQGGDKKAFSELYKMTEHMVVYVIRNRGVADDDVKDVAQEAYYKVFEKIGTLSDPQRAYGWIRKIAFTTACDHMKSAQVNNEITTSEEELALDDPLWKEEIELPEDIVVQGEAIEQLAALVKELPEDVHQLLVAKYYNEMSFPEISKAFGINENTVKAKIRRALDKMNKQMRSMGTTTLTITPAPILIYRLLSAEAEKSAIPAGLATGVGAIAVGSSAAAMSTTAAAVTAEAKAGLVLGFLSKRAVVAAIIGAIAIGGGTAAAVSTGIFKTEEPAVETVAKPAVVTTETTTVTTTATPEKKAETTPEPRPTTTPKPTTPTPKPTTTPKTTVTPTPTEKAGTSKTTPAPTSAPQPTKAPEKPAATPTPKPATPAPKPADPTPKPAETTPKPAEPTPTPVPAHVHTWVTNTETVHHDEVGHYEDVVVGTRTVVDEEAFDEPVVSTENVCSCGEILHTQEDYDLHLIIYDHSYTTMPVVTDYIHHDAVTHEEPITENRWIVDSPAWDETISTTVCSGCGATR